MSQAVYDALTANGTIANFIVDPIPDIEPAKEVADLIQKAKITKGN